MQAQLDALATLMQIQGAQISFGGKPFDGCSIGLDQAICDKGRPASPVLRLAAKQDLAQVQQVGSMAYVTADDEFYGLYKEGWRRMRSEAVCGDGKVGQGEVCDDGNATDDDACTNKCQVNTGYPCKGGSDCVTGKCHEGLTSKDSWCAPTDTACADDTAGAPAAFSANGTVACVGNGERTCSAGAWTPLVLCSSEACVAGVHAQAQTCEVGKGCQPKPAVAEACSPYTCGDPACKTSCSANGDCADGYTCADGKCVILEPNPAGTILAGSAYAGPPIAGYSQCAGFKNTGAWDILKPQWVHGCASDGAKKWRVVVYEGSSGAVLFSDTFPSYTQTELNNNIAGCSDSGYGTCGKSSTDGTGRALLVYKPTNGNGGCHGDDNSQGAFRISTSTSGNTMGNNYLFVGGKRTDGFRAHKINGSAGIGEVRFPGGNATWDGCGGDSSVQHAVTVYRQN